MDNVKDYFSLIEEIVTRSPLIASHEISYEEKSRKIGLLFGKIIIVDSRTMEFLELVKIQEGIHLIKYRYHLMDTGGNLIFRYDNSPHHREINSFPHHKHIMRNGKETTEETRVPNLSMVLDEIRETL